MIIYFAWIHEDVTGLAAALYNKVKIVMFLSKVFIDYVPSFIPLFHEHNYCGIVDNVVFGPLPS